MKYQRIECKKVMIDGKEYVPIKALNSLAVCDGCVADQLMPRPLRTPKLCYPEFMRARINLGRP